jgi:hypothetical protein
MRTPVPVRRRTVPKPKSEPIGPLVFWIVVILGAFCLGEIWAYIRW